MERCRIWMPDLYFQYFRNWSFFYEAAELDGASKWKQIRYITLPSIMPSVITLTLLNIGRIFYSDFGLFYQVTQNSGQLYDTTNVIDTYVYRALLQSEISEWLQRQALSVHCRICLCTAGKCGCAQIKPWKCNVLGGKKWLEAKVQKIWTIGTYGHDTGYNLYCIAVYLVIYVIYYLWKCSG